MTERPFESERPGNGSPPDGGTMLYNYDSPMVMDFLIFQCLFLAGGFPWDGLRMDDVDAMLYLDYGRKDGWTPNMYGSMRIFKPLNF